MGTTLLHTLFSAPEINPINHKAKTIPVLNPFNRYGRVFFFSWLGFMVAFLSWYAFPPLLTDTIKQDLHMTQTDVANSNIVALLATLVIRFISGPLCDRFGPRWVFIGVLLCGAIPTAMAGLVTTPRGLIAVRFFVGILGASFVPCQVWTTGFFDKNVVGTANALAAGWGNAGGGITYFLMPAIFDSLVQKRGLTPHQAWRVSYIVPFIIITAVALGMLFTCDDTPTGKWSERLAAAPDLDNIILGKPENNTSSIHAGPSSSSSTTEKKNLDDNDTEAQEAVLTDNDSTQQPQRGHSQVFDQETIIPPTMTEAKHVIFSLSTFSLAATYACTFGAELALDSILGSYYSANFPHLGQTESGRWAAMFGLLNVIFRPLGGYISDLLYTRGPTKHSVWAKKLWQTFLGVVTGAFLIAIGLDNPKSQATMFGLSAGLAFFLEAANGANFGVVPHVFPFANGIVSGIVGAFGNLGGIIFAIIFRYNGVHYGRSIWIMGVICMAVFVGQAWIRPVPRGM